MRAGVLGVVDQDREGSGEIAARSGQAFKEVLNVEVHRLVVERVIVDAADGEVELDGEDVALEGHAVADFDVVLRGCLLADDASSAVGDEGSLLFG